ncbi:family 43 glycosylhydrolase [Algibacter mikhailovii]|uniref:family 43 glycosylhydrolase n=1 Tax=Algibacter mikhailovii TaxID=425498 RepID=UPI0024955A85|nr:family 43 glycosylhydrolase [Algibacter mikhailovii]
MTYNNIFILIGICAAGLFAVAQNPILKLDQKDFMYAADPAAEVYDDKVYVYCSHDQDTAVSYSTMQDYLLLESADLKTWKNHGVILKPREYEWAHGQMNAPDVAYKNGWYYFYFPYDKTHIGVAKSKTPVGPWEAAVSTKITTIFDPTVFIDDDGQAYIYGSDSKQNIGEKGKHIMGAKLKDNMLELDGEWQRLSEETVAEAVYCFKRNGIYYFMARKGWQTAYWMANKPLPTKPFAKFKGYVTKNQIDAPAHMSVIEFKNEWYYFYQRGDVNKGTFHKRSACFEKLQFHSDGSMEPIQYTLDAGVKTNVPVTPIKL